MGAEKLLLKRLYNAVKDYFASENDFRRSPSSKTWDAKRECDRKLTTITAEVREYLKNDK